MFKLYEVFADLVVYQLLGLKPGERLSEALHFFIYDTLKIFMLLVVIIFTISFIRSFFPLEKTRRILAKHKAFSLPLAAFLGVLTPFCSCSAVPMFIGFVEVGIPLEAAFTFLVASPMVNEIAVGILFSLFGLKITLLYVGLGMLVAIVSGYVIGKLNPRELIADYVFEIKIGETKEQEMGFKDRIRFAWENVKNIIGKVWLFILVAIGIGGFIHGYVPKDLVEKVAKTAGFLSIPLVVLIGIPLYSNAAGVLPLVQPLIEKGVPIGTALAFMMATTALSLPEFMILKQIMKTKLIVIFASVVGISIMVVGYIINFLV